MIRRQQCCECGTELVWLRSYGFGDPRPVELAPQPDGDVVVEPPDARFRTLAAGEDTGDRPRYRLHWPCPKTSSRGRVGQPAPARPPGEPLEVSVVPHFHWDREWYVPFQTYRRWLVGAVDEVLDTLDRDPTFAHFLLDGQTAALDDYLEIRPENEGRIRALVGAGRLAVGPWLTLMDQFMVSGETTVRSLELGWRRASDLGGAMPVGYLPDMFGHIAQMPQILRLAGIEHAIVFRGVPDAVDTTAFWWDAPDGSRVRTEFLRQGYGNGARFEDDGAALAARAHDYERVCGAGRVGALLVMNGFDHSHVKPWAARACAEANALDPDVRFVVRPLYEHLAAQPSPPDLPVVAGELRASGAHSVIMGTTSNRMDVKRIAAAAERAVERRGEPLAALFVPAPSHPRRLLELAARNLVLDAAHDSSCACSHDEVVEQVIVRYREARQIGDGVADDALEALAASVDGRPGDVVVANASARSRDGVVELRVAGHGPLHLVDPDGHAYPAQVVAVDERVQYRAVLSGAEVEGIAGLVVGDVFGGVPVSRVDVREHAGDADVVLETAAEGARGVALDELATRLRVLARTADTVTITVLDPAVRHVLARTAPVPGFGWKVHRVVDGEASPDGDPSPVRAGDTWLDNGLVRVDVDPSDGTFAVRTADGVRVRGLNRYVDGGDGGDTYSWSPPDDDVVVDTPDEVRVSLIEPGPVRARLLVGSTYRWPAAAVGTAVRCTARTTDHVRVEVRTTVEVRSGERFVRVAGEMENTARDHRLRAHFPLPAPVQGSDAGCAFAVVHRRLDHEGNVYEMSLPTYPARRFVDASDGDVGLALLHDGVSEYEIVGGGEELALTVLRAIGFLSREYLTTRRGGAGPTTPIPDAQLPGLQRWSYAVLLHRGDWEAADLHAAADDVHVPLDVAPVPVSPARERGASGGVLHVEGAEVTSLRREGGALVLRAYRAASTPGQLRVDRRGSVVDLRGDQVRVFDGTLPLRPWEIVTLRLEDR